VSMCACVRVCVCVCVHVCVCVCVCVRTGRRVRQHNGEIKGGTFFVFRCVLQCVLQCVLRCGAVSCNVVLQCVAGQHNGEFQ